MQLAKANHISEIQEKYAQQLDETNQLIRAKLTSLAPQTIQLDKTLQASRGKQLRPLFTYSIFNGFNNFDTSAPRLAAVFESIHIASLLHDDVIDDCHLRRNLPTLNSVFGSGVAILLGDLVFVGIYRLTADLGELWLIQEVNNTIHELIEGELIQQQKKFDNASTVIDYQQIITRKTAALLELCCYASAKFSGQNEEVSKQLKKFGNHFGIIFQIVDDWADFFRSGYKDHKDRGVDIANGFITLPWLLLLKSCNHHEKEKIQNIINSHLPTGMSDTVVKELAIKYQIKEQVTEKIMWHYQQAITILDGIPHFDSHELKVFLNYVIQELNEGRVKQ